MRNTPCEAASLWFYQDVVQVWGYRTFGVSFGAVFCCVGAVVRVLKLGWPGFMGGQKVCLGSGFFVVVPRDKSV